MTNLQITDPDQRRQRYLEVLGQALRSVPQPFAGIIFAENSGADLSPFRDMVKGNECCEVLSVPTTANASLGRGYLETELVLQAVDSSQIVAHHPELLVWKMTGRYWASNLTRLVDYSSAGMDLYINLRRYPNPWADMWIYGATSKGFKMLEQSLRHLVERDGRPAEARLYHVIRELAEGGAAVSTRFPVEPRLEGQRGFDGVHYNSARQRVKWLTRSLARRLVPDLWI